MELLEDLKKEWSFLKVHKYKNILISTTAKHSLDFRVLPRRFFGQMAMSCFMINDEEVLGRVLSYFDGKIDQIYIDIEQKQNINLFKIAKVSIYKSKLVTTKPNDSTLEACDLLIRNQFDDDLCDRNVLVIGTGNLASKIAIRLSERQAHVYIKGRSIEKELALVKSLNLFLPKYTQSIKSSLRIEEKQKFDVVVSALSGQFQEEKKLFPITGKDSLIIDVGINNFSKNFIQSLLKHKINIVRLDTRIAFPYQMLSSHEYTQKFFKEILGQTIIDGVLVASGGYIGTEGTIIVDNIKQPNQIIGVADGRGGVKKSEQLTESDRNGIRKLQQTISKLYKTTV